MPDIEKRIVYIIRSDVDPLRHYVGVSWHFKTPPVSGPPARLRGAACDMPVDANQQISWP